jgi:hypothetical protein
VVSTQLALPVEVGPRTLHPSGLQVPCVGCAAAGIDRLGLPRDGLGPLCMRCWTGRLQRAQREQRAQLRAQLWEGIGAAAAAAVCPACGSDVPAEPVRVKGKRPPGCWLCSHRWLADMRAQFEADQAAAQLAELAEQQRSFAQLAEITTAELQVHRWEVQVQRCRGVLDAAGTGGRRARPVALLAAAYARFGIPRRGRPPVWPRVAAVTALLADFRSGRYSRPGRADTALLAGCSERAVTEALRFLEDRPATPDAPGTGEPGPNRWMLRTVEGRLATLQERRTLHTHRIRAEFDVEHLHRLPVPEPEHLAAALATFGELLGALAAQHAAAVAALDQIRQRYGAVADVVEYAHRAALRAAVARARADIDERVSSPHPVGLQVGDSLTPVCSFWVPVSRENSTPDRGAVRRPGAAAGNGCAARAPTGGDPRARSPRVEHPRKRCGGCAAPVSDSVYIDSGNGSGDVSAGQSVADYNITVIMRGKTTQCHECPKSTVVDRPRRARPEWSLWAYDLARDLRAAWPGLRRGRAVDIAAVLGKRLGPGWTAEALLGWATRQRGRPLLAAPNNPRGYLVTVLEESFTGLDEPPAPARLHDQRRRELVADERAVLRAAAAARRAELDERDRAVAGPDAPGRLAARAAARAAGASC